MSDNNHRLTAVQLAHIFGVTRQAIYISGRQEWTPDDVRQALADERAEMEQRHKAILIRLIDFEV